VEEESPNYFPPNFPKPEKVFLPTINGLFAYFLLNQSEVNLES